MNDTITIYGASDDLIEVNGAVTEEFNALGDGERYIAVSNGVVVRIHYSQSGVWRINLVARPNVGVEVVIVSAPEDDDDNYSDRCVITGGDIRWVVLGSEVAP